jgi:hydroxymethylglutaryl-CoA synthase
MDFWRPLYSKEAFADGHYSIECYLTALNESLLDAGKELPLLSDLSAALYHVPFVKMAAKAHKKHVEFSLGRSVEKETEEFEQFKASYQAKTAPWLELNAQVGNIYTASLFLSLMNLLVKKQTPVDQPILLFSYGSGCASSLSIASLVEGYEHWAERFDPTQALNERRKLAISQYEDMMATRSSQEQANVTFKPEDWGLTGTHFYLGNKENIRQYSDLDY